MTRFCIRSKRRNILPSRKRFSLVFAGRKKVPRGVINWISSWVWHNLWAKEMSLDRFPRCDADIIGREGMLHWPVVRVYRSVISAFACCPYGFLMKERHMQWQHYQGQSQSITSERGVCLKSETKFTVSFTPRINPLRNTSVMDIPIFVDLLSDFLNQVKIELD